MRRIAAPSGDVAGPGIALGAASRPENGPALPISSIPSERTAPDAPASGRSRWYAMAASGALHAGLLAALIVRVEPVPPPVPPGTMQVTYVSLPGDPPSGDPEGDSAPARTAPAAEAPEAAESEPTPVSETPTESPRQSDPEPADGPTETRTTAPPGPVVNPENPGSGTLAMGARTHGDAQGLDPALVASVSLALATRIRACWEQPVGTAPNDMASSVVVRYAPDGSIQGEPAVVHLVDGREISVASPNEWERQAVDAARRCSPMLLPKALYPYWRKVEIQVYSVR